ncbi:MAG: hypothetical protein NZ533_02840 [Casimicrobiaceae bacterium]|nr:hypothetical protein [Casimicrobiaceae bacterium]MCX8098664.1 hypothetical protein [Casimicrobiaceae bacterium]MDW8311857.1 hypothetical protein [Burkholderiales bacterium]
MLWPRFSDFATFFSSLSLRVKLGRRFVFALAAEEGSFFFFVVAAFWVRL